MDVMTATITELPSACHSLMSDSTTRCTLVRKFGPGISEGMGFFEIVAASDEDSRNVKYSG